MTDYKEISKLSDTDITEFVGKEREALRALRFGKVERNSSAARQHKTNIARALTEQTKRANTPTTK